jgi:hypothetical protein
MTMDWLPQVSILVVEPVAAGRGGERRRDVWDLWCQICIEKGGDGYWALCGYAWEIRRWLLLMMISGPNIEREI